MPKFTTQPTPMFSFWCLFLLLCHRNVSVLLVYKSFSSSSSFNQSQFTFQMSSEFCCASYTDFFFDSTMFFFFFTFFRQCRCLHLSCQSCGSHDIGSDKGRGVCVELERDRSECYELFWRWLRPTVASSQKHLAVVLGDIGKQMNPDYLWHFSDND